MNKQVSILLLSALLGAQALHAADKGAIVASTPAASSQVTTSAVSETPAIVEVSKHSTLYTGAAVATVDAAAAGTLYGTYKLLQNREAVWNWITEHPYQATAYTVGALTAVALSVYAWHNWLPTTIVNSFVKVGALATYDGAKASAQWGWSKTPWAREVATAAVITESVKAGVHKAGLPLSADGEEAEVKSPEAPKAPAAPHPVNAKSGAEVKIDSEKSKAIAELKQRMKGASPELTQTLQARIDAIPA